MMPDWETAVHIGRWTNFVLATAAFALLLVTIRRWKFRSPGNRFLWMAVGLAVLNTAFGTAEQMIHNQDGGWRTAVTSVFLAWLIAALVLKKLGRWHDDESPHSNKDG